MEIMELDSLLVAMISLGINVLLFIFILIIWGRFRSTERKFVAMIGQTNVPNLQDVMVDIQSNISSLQDSRAEFEHAIQAIHSTLKGVKGNVAIHRYNAFQEHGSDLSFSIAIVDDHMNGVVLTGIHGREESYMYGKPLIKGESSYTLSPEERKVINSAMNKMPQPVLAAASGADRRQ